MFEISVLIGLSRLIQTHIACEIDTAKITAALFGITYCLNDLIRLDSIVSHVQTTKCTNDANFAVRFHYQLSVFGIRVLIGLSRLCHAHIAYETDGAKIITEFCRISNYLYDLIRLIQSSAICKSKMYDDVVFDDPFRYQLIYV